MLNHFQTLLLFAFFASLAFAFLSKKKLGERVRYAIWAFLAFVIVAIAIGWLMYPLTR